MTNIENMSCHWVQEESGLWETDCGQLWQIIEGTPADNNMRFCHYCGKTLVEHTPIQNPDDA